MDQSNKAISIGYQEWFFGERSLLPSVGTCRPICGQTESGAWKAKMEVVIQKTFEVLS
jgi:hypothetical protein